MAGYIEEFLLKREREGVLRRLHPASYRKNGSIYFPDGEYTDFSSNDYLGLAGHPRLVEAAKEALDAFGTSSSASRLLSGDMDIHHRLEDAVAVFKGKEASLVFNSGYQANAGLFASLYGKGDVIFSDRLNHASIVDGLLLSRAKTFRFKHNDVNDLEDILKRERGKFKKALIVTETIFSMDGDRPQLKELVDLKTKYDCTIMADEAHATGIYGPNGSGVVEEEGLQERIDIIMGTFGKALGSFGAYIAASKGVIDYLINTCRSFIYSTSLPPSVAACNLKSLELVKEEPYRRINLLENAQYFRDRLKSMSIEIRGSSHIVPVIIGENERTKNAASKLQAKGWWVLPIRPPTVPAGQSRLRFSLCFPHNFKILRGLAEDISNVGI